ncbi:MAG TPA: hypothetical protein VG797_00070 [Phycisphaerales bacterium]|nr:hypothetical protein [Phycisphaerales bacterium]
MVQSSSLDLLRKLGSGVRPESAASGPGGAIESRGFADLLKSVRDGAISSNRPLSLAKGAEGKLSPDQLNRLSIAADAAEASGSYRLLAVVDGQAVKIDIASRTIESVTSHDPAKVYGDVDSVVFLPTDPNVDLRSLFGGEAPAAALPPGVQAPIRNESMASLLANLQKKRYDPSVAALKP